MGIAYSPPLEGCPKGGVVVGWGIAVIFIEVGNTYHHPVRLRLPPLRRRGILGGIFPSFGGVPEGRGGRWGSFIDRLGYKLRSTWANKALR